MTDLRQRLGAARLEGEAARHRHRYDRPPTQAAIEAGEVEYACRCGKRKDPAATRKGRAARKRGNRRELYVERRYGPTKIGQRGDAIDNLGSSFKWQSKTTTADPPLWAMALSQWSSVSAHEASIEPARWFVDPMEAMAGLHDDLAPLVIRSWTHRGRRGLDVIIVRAVDWLHLHGLIKGTQQAKYVAMTGEHFLDVHGKDER